MAYKPSLRPDGYLNDFHKKSSEEIGEAIKKMRENPLSVEEMQAQMDRHNPQMKPEELIAYREKKRRLYLDRLEKAKTRLDKK